ncbi:Ig-like domain-containing protein [Spirosoma validum]|uniref:T9SS type A sorting domain-containing protein n=1 Tax=Spirosoma validum TaxID=2771355 RepID=A0A927GEK0_9BACT|nr:T9SS type A sorting domain-containing protein [Spirosoma validum]MBD2754721.1 T9SS type A sorting domain-containing protein [Spirosoma validum]
MNGRKLYSYLFIWFCICSLTINSLAQTITTGSITPSTICPGGVVTVTFTTSGTFAAANTFSAQLSDASGTFAATPTVIGTVASTSAVAISATIPSSTVNGSYKIRVVSSAAAVIGSSQALAVNVPAAPGTSPVSYCVGQAASVLTATGTNLKWYTAQTGGTPLAVTPTPSTTVASSTTYYVSQTVDGCESERASLVVTINNQPPPPGVTNIGLCINGPTSPLTATGSNLKWYDANDNLLSGAPTPSTSTLTLWVYKVSQTSAIGCESPKATITANIKSRPAGPSVTPPTPYCQGAPAAPLSATGESLLWYGTDANGGIGSTAAPVPSTDTPGEKTYYVTQTVTGCENSPRTPIVVTVKPKPTAPGTSPVSYCVGQAASVLTATGTNLKWYTAQTGGTPLAVTPTPSTTVASSTTYYVSQTVDGCESERASLVVTINNQPPPPGVTNIGLCINGPTSPLTATGSNLKWYDANDNLLSGAPTPSTSTLTLWVYKVSQTSAIGCESPKATITANIKSRPAGPSVTPPTPYCQGAPAAPLSATGESLLWYGTDANGGIGSTAAPVPSTDTPGEKTYYVTQTVTGCENSPRTPIVVTVKPKPTAPGTTAIAFCQNVASPSLVAVFAANTSPNWYGTNATGGSATTTAPIPPNNVAQTIVYYVSQTLDGCESDRASLSVRVKPLPAAPAVTAVSFCNTSAASALTASGNELKWYDGTGNPLGAPPTPNTSAVGNQTFKVSQTLESCEGPKADLVVTIKPLPDAPGTSNLFYCLPTQDQPAQNVAALTAAGQNLKWFNPSDGNIFSSAPIPSIGQLGTQSFQVSQTVNGCEGGKSTLQVTIRTTAVPTVSKPLVTYCINDKPVPLEASAESGGSLRWVNPYDQISNDAPIPSTLNTSIQAGGDPFYVFQIGQNTCYSGRSVVRVLVNALPTLSLIPSATSINLGQRVNLNLKFTSTAPYSYTLTDGLSGVSNKADTTISVLPRATTTYQITTIRNSCGVGLPGNPATATITVRIPTVTTSALTTSTLCVGTSLSVPFTTTGEFNQGNAFRIELVSVADTSKKYGVSATATISPVTAPLPLTLVGGQYYVRVKADNPEIAVTGSNSPTLLTIRPQPTAALTGTQNIYEGYPANLTLTLGGESPWTVVYADSVRSYSATATTNPYAVEVRPSRTTTYRLVSVANVCGNGPISGTATVSVLPLLGIDDNPLDPLVKTYPIPTTSVVTIELDLPLTRDSATLSLSDMSGRQVLQQTTRNRKQDLDLTSQPNGLYLLRIQVGDRQTVRKILKQ